MDKKHLFLLILVCCIVVALLIVGLSLSWVLS